MTQAVLFDLGNTLVKYYQIDDFQPILQQAVDRVLEDLKVRGIDSVSSSIAMEKALHENREAEDNRFSPMVERLERIFGLSIAAEPGLGARLCEIFLGPIFEIGFVYEDSMLALERLKSRGFKLGIVSNVPWGSPPDLWRSELKRLGLSELVENITLCGDVGWRKPARQIFEHASKALAVPCSNCIFVGDEPAWDMEGSTAVGMRAVLIDRHGRYPDYEGERVMRLDQLLEIVSG